MSAAAWAHAYHTKGSSVFSYARLHNGTTSLKRVPWAMLIGSASHAKCGCQADQQFNRIDPYDCGVSGCSLSLLAAPPTREEEHL